MQTSEERLWRLYSGINKMTDLQDTKLLVYLMCIISVRTTKCVWHDIPLLNVRSNISDCAYMLLRPSGKMPSMVYLVLLLWG